MPVRKSYCLISRPEKRVSLSHFNITSQPIPTLSQNQVRVKVTHISIDPTNRIWMSDKPQYMPPVALGEVMRAIGIGVVEESTDPQFEKGDLVSGLLGWTTHAICQGREITKLPKLNVPPSTFLSVLGMTSFSAYFGLLDIGQPKPGETVVISAAAGAVGSIACQIAKLKGTHVVGVAGTPEKCAWLKDSLGVDATINYKEGNLLKQLQAAAPNGIDVYFENVGGPLFEAVLQHLNLFARIPLCGLISGYNETGPTQTPQNFEQILMKRAKIQGFIILDYQARFSEAFSDLLAWYQAGHLTKNETILKGFDSLVDAVNMLFDGKNQGKLIVEV